MSRRQMLPMAVFAIATAFSTFAVTIDVRGGHGQSSRPGLNCQPCTDPCLDAPNVVTTCVDKQTGESFLATYACCCCNDQWKHRKLIGPK